MARWGWSGQALFVMFAVLNGGLIHAQSGNELVALNRQVVRLYEAGKYAEAIPIAQRALALAEKTLPENHRDIAWTLKSLADLYQAQGRLAEAELLLKRVIAIYERTLGPTSAIVSESIENLARLYRAQGRLAEAETLLRFVPILAQGGPLVLLAAQQVALDADREVLIRSAKVTGNYTALRINVRESEVYVVSVRIMNENGREDTIPVNAAIEKGASSNWLGVVQPSAAVKIYVSYRAAPEKRGQAWIEITGLSDKPDVDRAAGKAVDPALIVPQPVDCVAANICTPIEIFFGTNRERKNESGRVTFGPDRKQSLSLGSTVVTVPKGSGDHRIGEVERPTFWSFRDWFSFFKEDPARHFTVPKDGTRIFATPEEFIGAVRAAAGELREFKAHAFIFVHGFNVEFDAALYRLAQMTYDLGVDIDGSRIPFGLPFLFSWPARGGAFGVKDYMTDAESAELSEPYLKEFLELVVTQSQVKNVHLIAHSMGSRPLLKVLEKIASAARPEIKFNQIVLAAPDIDRDVFLGITKDQKLAQITSNVTLYASSSDKAIKLSTKLHGGYPRAGDVSPKGPVVVKGVDTIDVSKVSTAFFSLEHSIYAHDVTLLNDIGLLVRSGKRPPHERTPVLRQKQNPSPGFWFYPK